MYTFICIISVAGLVLITSTCTIMNLGFDSLLFECIKNTSSDSVQLQFCFCETGHVKVLE